MEKIKLYAKPEFTHAQMHEIFEGILSDLSIHQILIYAKREFNSEQMTQIRWGLSGIDTSNEFSNFEAIRELTEEEVLLYARPEFTKDQMWEIRECFEHGLVKDEVSIIANPDFSEDQMYIMKEAYSSGLTIKQVELFADPRLTPEQMDHCCHKILCEEPEADVSLYKEVVLQYNLPDELSSEYINAIKEGIPKEKLELIAKSDTTPEQKMFLFHMISNAKKSNPHLQAKEKGR